MNFFQLIVMSIVEGITEFLPISSTFHLDIFAQLLHIPQTDFLTSFIIAIQLGAIVAIVILMKEYLFYSLQTWLSIMVGFLPVGIVGIAIYPFFKNILLGNIIVEFFAVMIGGIVLLFFAKKYKEKTTDEIVQEKYVFTLKEFLLLGCWQVLGLIPGVSRSGATLVGGLVHNMPLQKIVVGSFLLAIPTMFAATGYDLLKTGFSFTGTQWGIIGLGMIFSGSIAYFVARWLLQFIKKPSALYLFGWYRIVVAVIILILFIL
jgi:undecaprenyl-diphosphatase